jgi:hypothetical protein
MVFYSFEPRSGLLSAALGLWALLIGLVDLLFWVRITACTFLLLIRNLVGDGSLFVSR